MATQAQLTYYNLQNQALPNSILLVRDYIIGDVDYYLTYVCQRQSFCAEPSTTPWQTCGGVAPYGLHRHQI